MDYNNNNKKKKTGVAPPRRPRGNGRRNYFENEINRNGKDFLLRKSPDKLRNDSIRIIRDMANGNITISYYEEYFKVQELIAAIIDYSETRAREAELVYKHMMLAITCNGNISENERKELMHIQNKNMYIAQAYRLVSNKFNLFWNTHDFSVLSTLNRELYENNQYRNVFYY